MPRKIRGKRKTRKYPKLFRKKETAVRAAERWKKYAPSGAQYKVIKVKSVDVGTRDVGLYFQKSRIASFFERILP